MRLFPPYVLLPLAVMGCDSGDKDVEFLYSWSVVPQTITVTSDVTIINNSTKVLDQAFAACTVVAGGKTYKDALTQGTFNGPLRPGEPRTWHGFDLGTSPTGTNNITDVSCRITKVKYQ